MHFFNFDVNKNESTTDYNKPQFKHYLAFVRLLTTTHYYHHIATPIKPSTCCLNKPSNAKTTDEIKA